ncbi:MAG: hypothetical protein WKI46_05020 [Aquificaceae bacterium]
MKRAIHFIEGYGSILRIIPARKSDRENIISDWKLVGNYLWHAIEEEVNVFGGEKGFRKNKQFARD